MELERSTEPKMIFINCAEAEILEQEMMGKEDFQKVLQDIIQGNFPFTNPLLGRKKKSVKYYLQDIGRQIRNGGICHLAEVMF